MRSMIGRGARDAAPLIQPTSTVILSSADTQCEVALWLAVIDQALTDATLGLLKKRRPGKARGRVAAVRKSHRDQARSWLLGMSEEFREVCWMAGLEPDAVHEAAQRQIAEADAILMPPSQTSERPDQVLTSWL